jgi:hypothetical protein
MRVLSRRHLRRFPPPALTTTRVGISGSSYGMRAIFFAFSIFLWAMTYIFNARRMAQFVKSIKKRTFKDPLTNSPSSNSASIEEATSFEGEVAQFLISLPPAFKLDINADLPTITASAFSTDFPERSSSSACLIAQQCELVIIGQKLILKIYLPFLRPNRTGSTCNTNHQAAVRTITAAHAIIHAMRVLHAICKQQPGSQSKRPGPAILDYCSFRQALFDAAVVCAHSVIMQPSAIWARVALDDVVNALEVMKDPAVATGRGSLQACVEGCISEPVKIIEMLKRKANGARAGNNNSPSKSVPKSKHSGKVKWKNKKDMKGQYPTIGMRVRLSKEAPAVVRHRESTHSTASTTSLTETKMRMQVSGSSSLSNMSAPTPTNSHHSFGVPAMQIPSPNQSPLSADSIQPPTQQEAVHHLHNEYPSSFVGADNGSLHMNISSVHTIQEASAQHGYSSRPPNQMLEYFQNPSNLYTSTPSSTSFRPSSSGQPPNGSSSFGGGSVGMSSQHQSSTPFAHSHVSSTQPYEPSPPSAYFAPPLYKSKFDNGVQGPLRVLTMDNATNGPLTPSPNDLIFYVKPQNGNHLQQPFGDARGQVQGWQPGYKQYFST